jgi:hypothetical protein
MLTCRAFPAIAAETDLDAIGLLNRAYDAWADCRARLDAIRHLQGEQP